MFSVIFDMDGTLLDTQRAILPSWDYAGEKMGYGPLGHYMPEVCGMNRAGWEGFLKERHPDMDVAKFTETFVEYLKDHEEIKFKAGALELLDFLKENGIKTAVASGSNTWVVKRNMQTLGITDYFDALIGGDCVENGKPAPDIFLLAAEKMGAFAGDCFVFEDSSGGIKAGAAAGCKVIGIPDLVQFGDDIRKLLFAELKTLDEAINILKNYL